MTNILISTSRRRSSINKPSGHLIVFDLETNNILKTCEIIEPPYREYDPNPRGGFRGLKGIAMNGDRIAIANSSTVFIYDHAWNPTGYFFHPSCAGIHDIEFQDGKIWVTCARNDLLCLLDQHGKMIKSYDARTFVPAVNSEHWQPRPFMTSSQVANGKINFRDPRTHDEIFSDTSHLNSVAILKNGDLLVSLGLLKNPTQLQLLKIKNWMVQIGLWSKVEDVNRLLRKWVGVKKNRQKEELIIQPQHGQSSVVRITPAGKVTQCLCFDGLSAPSHSLRLLRDGSGIYLKTTTGELVHFNPDTGDIYSSHPIGEKFLRGACELLDGSLLLGDNNSLLHYDLQDHRVLKRTIVSDDQTEAIFDIQLLPEGFDLPPDSFVAHHEQYMPVIQC